MAQQQTIDFAQPVSHSKRPVPSAKHPVSPPKHPESSSQQPEGYSHPVAASDEPLQLEEMLSLIKLAHELGYSVKDARDMKSLYDVIASDLYSVWFAIENEIAIFADNILDLIEFTGWQGRQQAAPEEESEEDIHVDYAVAS